jgi:hypothetical protein
MNNAAKTARRQALRRFADRCQFAARTTLVTTSDLHTAYECLWGPIARSAFRTFRRECSRLGWLD